MIRQQAQLIREEEVAALIGAALGENNPERATWQKFRQRPINGDWMFFWIDAT